MSLTIKPGVTIGPGVSAKVPVYVPPVQQYTLTINVVGTGNGIVQGSPGNINVSRIPGTGSYTFDDGSYTYLIASAAMGSTFIGWSGGGASGTGPAEIHIQSDTTVTATFNAISTLVNIAVTPTNVHLPRGVSQQMIATATFSDGSYQDYTNLVTWSSTDQSVATVVSGGIVTGVSTGTINIQATYQAITGSVVFAVTPASLLVITLTPTNPAVIMGSTIQLHATGTFSDGSEVDLTSQVLWSSTDDAVATVNGNGLVSGNAFGNCTIQASFNSVQTSIALFVAD